MSKLCPICHEEFEPVKHNQIYCHDCLDNRMTEIRRRTEAARRRKRAKRKLSYTKTINDIVEELNDYNERHGTLLSYGKYVSMMENGKLKD